MQTEAKLHLHRLKFLNLNLHHVAKQKPMMTIRDGALQLSFMQRQEK